MHYRQNIWQTQSENLDQDKLITWFSGPRGCLFLDHIINFIGKKNKCWWHRSCLDFKSSNATDSEEISLISNASMIISDLSLFSASIIGWRGPLYYRGSWNDNNRAKFYFLILSYFFEGHSCVIYKTCIQDSQTKSILYQNATLKKAAWKSSNKIN